MELGQMHYGYQNMAITPSLEINQWSNIKSRFTTRLVAGRFVFNIFMLAGIKFDLHMV
jgi:hypothetical protein